MGTNESKVSQPMDPGEKQSPVVDTGHYEVAVSFEGESGMLRGWDNCNKHPGHFNFVPYTQFTKKYLPTYCQTDETFDCIRAEADLTVRLHTRWASEKRPEKGYLFLDCEYQDALRCGTGWVRHIRHMDAKEKKLMAILEHCKCSDCWFSDTPKEEFWVVDISTALHMIYDESEAMETTCDLFYDEDGRDGVQKLSGVTAWGDGFRDSCWLECHTHDPVLAKKLEDMIRLRDELHKKLSEKYKEISNKHPLTVIVSHPHGRKKHITVGNWAGREIIKNTKSGPLEFGFPLTKYKYTNPTCIGSSGALVFILGKGLGWRSHTHEGRTEDRGINISCSDCD